MKTKNNFIKLFLLILFLSNNFIATNLFSMKRKNANINISKKRQKGIGNPYYFPSDVLLKVLGYLEPQCFSSFACTCKYFNNVLNSARIRDLNLGNIDIIDVVRYGNVNLVKKFIKEIEEKEEVNEETIENITDRL